ncbi:hypothetical protein N0V88_002292 [Collariella sp. IMI 366227]|nr:hypothetical protein N0V88_002292 [Collariella sp. IMI 366227]
MAITQTKVATAASIGLRALTYIFLRWIAPAIIATLFAIYLPSFISGYRNEPEYDLVDEVDVLVTDTVLKDEDAPRDRNGRTADEDKEVIAEDVTIRETITAEKRPLNPWRTLLTGAPNPRSLALSLATLVINGLCLGFVGDLGYVSEDEAKLVIREPDQAKMPVTVQVHIKDPQPPFDNPLWQDAGGVRWTTNETDYTAVVSIPLRHSKKRTYEWRTSNNHSGEFTAPSPIGHALETNYGPFTFLSTSCIVQQLPYNPLSHPLSIPGLKHLAKVLPTLNAQFMLFLGDFIYADVPRYWSKSVTYYRQKYRQVYASPDWPAVGQNLSWIHVLDDHEIANDWSANSTGVYTTALDPFHHYQAAANPPPAKAAHALTPRSRTSRTSPSNALPASSTAKTMLGAEQLADFLAWLRRPEPHGVKWKIVASSVPFTKNWPVNTQDTWGGFLVERRKVLEAMWDVASRGGRGGAFGDRHEFAATKFPPPVDGGLARGCGERDREDVLVKYVYKGNSKFGAITIENLEGGDQSSLKYRLFVDGEEVWNTVVLSPPPVKGEKYVGGSFWDRFKIGA